MAMVTKELSPSTIKRMEKASKFAAIAGTFIFLGVWVIWPFAMYGSDYVMSKQVRFKLFRSYGLN